MLLLDDEVLLDELLAAGGAGHAPQPPEPSHDAGLLSAGFDALLLELALDPSPFLFDPPE